ncbi:MAG: endonuclease III [Bacteroidales bacterium]|nr:endonuclease III [Bacteroidales bacterium]
MAEKITLARKRKILKILEESTPNPVSELNYNSPYELIVAVMLSAQCTDKRVNMVTPALFKKYPTVEKLAKADVEMVKELVKSVSYPNSKAEHLVGMAKMLVADFGSQIPVDVEQLMRLPGIGRKSANVVASICFAKPVIAVDTHVYRVAHRMGLSQGNTPYNVEQDLEKLVPLSKRADAHHWLILHGRYVCKAQKPLCNGCVVEELCPKLLEGSKLSERGR